MGTFDIVILGFSLPDAGAADVTQWQTIDFLDPHLRKYKITANGRLFRERERYEDRSDPQFPIGICERLAGSMTPIHEGWEDVHFHGILNFYGDKHSGETRSISFAPETLGKDILHPEPAEWFEYNAKFTDGQLVSIERVLRPRVP
jgi:hypothetical protein